MSGNEIIKLTLEAENLISEETNDAISDLVKLSAEAKKTKDELSALEQADRSTRAFIELSNSIEKTKNSLANVNADLAKLKQEAKSAGGSLSEDLTLQIEKTKIESQSLKAELTAQNSALRKTTAELSKLGIDTSKVTDEQNKLKTSLAQVSNSYNQLTTKQQALRAEAVKTLDNVRNEVANRRTLINSLEADEQTRSKALDVINNQAVAVEKINNRLKDEVVSRHEINKVTQAETIARKRLVNDIQKNIDLKSQEIAQAKANESALIAYRQEYEQLAKLYARSEIDKKTLIDSEKDLQKFLGLTESQVKETRKEISLITNEYEKWVAKQYEAVQAEKQQAIETERVQSALKQYKQELSKLANEYVNGEREAVSYLEASKKVSDQLELEAKYTHDLKRAIEQEAKARKAAKQIEDNREAKIQQTKAETASLNIYSKELEKLNLLKKKSEITNQEYIRSEISLRRSLNLSKGQVADAKKTIESYSKEGLEQAAKKTDALTHATRRLAQAYTVLHVFTQVTEAVKQTVGSYAEYEDKLIGVQKVTGESTLQLEKMSEQLAYFSKQITSSDLNSLLEYTQAAGQMGIRGADNLQQMAIAADALASSTDLAGDEAVKGLSKILTITNEGTESIDNAASALVHLGNNYATTESQLLNFMREVAGSTSIAKLSTAEIGALSASMIQLGQTPERTKSAFGRVFGEINAAIQSGGQSMRDLTSITQLTEEQIRESFGKNSVDLFIKFSQGIKRINDEGGTTNDTLKLFNITSDETRSIMNLAADNTELLADALVKANEAYADGNKHIKEALQRWSTLQAEIARVNNTLTDFKKRIGESLGDETQQTLDTVKKLFTENGDEVLTLIEDIVDLGSSFVSLTSGIGSAIDAIFGWTEEATVASTVLTTLSNGFYAISGLLKSVSAGVYGLKIAFAEALGDTTAADQFREKIKDLAISSKADFDAIAENVKIMNGESSRSFEDLKRTMETHKDAVKSLSVEEQQRLESMIQGNLYQKEFIDSHNELTQSILRQHRASEIQSKLDDKRVIQITAQQQALLDQGKAMEVVLGTQVKYVESVDEILSGVFNLTEAQKLNKQAAQELLDPYSKLAKNIDEQLTKTVSYQEQIDALNLELEKQAGLYNAAVRAGTGYVEIEEKIYNIKSKIYELQQLQNTQQEVSNVKYGQAYEKVLAYRQQLEILERDYKNSNITLGEYTKKKQELTNIIKALEPALTDYQSSHLKLRDAIATTSRENERFTQTEAAKGQQIKATVENIDELVGRYNQLQRVSQLTGQSEIELMQLQADKGRQLVDSASATSLYADAQNYLNKEFDFSNDSIETMSNRINELTNLINQNSRVTSAWWRDLANVSNQAFTREQSILSETIALRQWIAEVESGTLSLNQLNNKALTANRYFSALSGNQLKPLTDAIAKAKSEFQELSEIIEDKTDSLQDRLDRLKGDEKAIADRAYQKELEELKTLQEQAKLTGDRDTQSKASESIRLLEQIKRLEDKNNRDKNPTNNRQTTTTNHKITINNGSKENVVNVQGANDVENLLDILNQLNSVTLNR